MSRQEIVTLEAVEMIRFLKPGVVDYECHEKKRDGRSLEELAKNYPMRCYALQTYTVLFGTVEIDGQTIGISSRPYNLAYHYYGGEVITQAAAQADELSYFLSLMETHHCTQLIKPEPNGEWRSKVPRWEPFRPERGDSVLNLGIK